jgi:hypothetical protein
VLFTLIAALAPRAALACPVCFGQNDSPLASAMNMGIFAMLGVVGAVLVAFASFFIYLMRRASKAAEAESGSTETHAPAQGFRPADAGPYAPNV